MSGIQEKKEQFLNKIKGTSQRFKRYGGSPLRYGGGKSLAVGYVVEHLPNDLKKVVSPFFGGGSVEIALAKELGIEVLGFDIFDMLTNYWHHQINKSDELYAELRKLNPTKEEYERVKNELKSHWNKHDGYDGKMDELLRAVYYFFNHNLSYGPGFLGWMSSNYLDRDAYERTIKKVRDFKVPNLKVKTGDFESIIPKFRDEFLYLDPPYFLEGDSKMFRGIYPMRNFPIHHNSFKHELLAELLKNHKGGFILSYNDCSWVRENYSKYKIIEVKWQYTMGQGETRIGKNRLERNYDNGNVKNSHEIIIVGNKGENK
jgi:DNA adenine methylase